MNDIISRKGAATAEATEAANDAESLFAYVADLTPDPTDDAILQGVIAWCRTRSPLSLTADFARIDHFADSVARLTKAVANLTLDNGRKGLRRKITGVLTGIIVNQSPPASAT
jgi:hypothetical protein